MLERFLKLKKECITGQEEMKIGKIEGKMGITYTKREKTMN